MDTIAPWEREIPHGISMDLDEYPVELLKMRVCRSFRADMTQKLTVIIRANGGHGHRGFYRTADRLRVNRHTLRRWLRWTTSPRNKLMLERIDNAYLEAVEELARQACARQRRP